MMRPVTVHVGWSPPAAPVLSFVRGSVVLNWTDGTPVDYANPATWGDPSAEVGYRIERAEVTGGVSGPYTQIANAPANSTTYTDTPPDPTLTYDYRVTAWNVAGASASNTVTVEGLPKAPTGLTTVVQSAPTLPSGAQVAVSWTNNSTGATSVEVERAVGAGAFSVLATLAPTDTSYVDTTVAPGPYSYRVRAIGAVGPSAYAGPVAVTVPQPGSTTVVLNGPNPSLVGQDVTFTATVSPVLATGTPTGTVTFTANGFSTSVPVDALGVATHTTAALPAGVHTITADYSGDAVFLPSTSSATQTVNKAGTATAVVSDLNPSTVGQTVTFTATVSPATATGTVQFTVDGAAVADVPLVAGQATYSTAGLATGAHAIAVTYGGDAAHLPSSSGTLTQTVGPVLRPTTTVVTSNRNPTATFGQNVTFTATVRPVTGTGIPTGTIQFNVDGADVGAAVSLNAQGRATYSSTGLSAGSHNIIAVYSGSVIFGGGGSATFVQIVNQAASTTVLTSNRNLSVSGQSITFTARVTPVAATGTVTFTVDGTPVAGPVTLDATGRARLVISSLAVGGHTVSANYNGSANHLPSATGTVTVTVFKATSRTVVTTSGSPAPQGTTVVFTATVVAVAPGAGTATGTVQFRIDGFDVGAPVALNSSGQAAYATSTMPVGSHTVAAVYAGDGNFNPSTSANITQRIR
jgi:hypothetical protein